MNIFLFYCDKAYIEITNTYLQLFIKSNNLKTNTNNTSILYNPSKYQYLDQKCL